MTSGKIVLFGQNQENLEPHAVFVGAAAATEGMLYMRGKQAADPHPDGKKWDGSVALRTKSGWFILRDIPVNPEIPQIPLAEGANTE